MPPTSKTRRTKKLLQDLSPKARDDLSVVNVYGKEVCKLWYRLHFGGHDYDLFPQSAGQQPDWNTVDYTEVAKEPGWWPWWLGDFSIDEALGSCYSMGCVEEYGRRWHQPWRNWALENGVAPGQLFCVEVTEPEVSKSGWEEVEYDIEWSAEILEVAPISPSSVTKRWEHDLRQTARGRLMHVYEAELNAKLVDRDVASMYIQQNMYSPGRQSSWGVPSGRSFSLQTKRRPHPCGATSMNVQGHDDDGDYDRAMQHFIDNACKANPHLSPEVIRSMEIRR